MDKEKPLYNPELHHRRSIRLGNYDYSQQGAYFITICTQHRECLFGSIREGQMTLNEAGEMVERWWLEINSKFSVVEVDEFIVMPNHFHGIILIKSATLSEIPPTLGRVVEWFKTMSTNAYIRGVKLANWPPFDGRVWHRNYFERIIRDGKALDLARQYIRNNPLQWAFDKENPERITPPSYESTL